MASEARSRTRAVTAASIDRFMGEFLGRKHPPRGDRDDCRREERFFETIIGLLGIEATTADMAPTPELVERYLKASTNCSSRGVLQGLLRQYALALDHAVASRYIEPSALVVTRPIPIPPACDEHDDRFSWIGATHRSVRSAPPAWDDFARVMAAMRAKSSAWSGARRYALWSTVVLGELKLAEALAIVPEDYAPIDHKLRIVERSKRRNPGPDFPPLIDTTGPLDAILSRWWPRVQFPRVFLGLSRAGPMSPQQITGDLAEFACEVLGSGEGADRFTPAGLLSFGKEHAERLKHSRESPLSIAPDDAETLALKRVSITQLKEEVFQHFKHTHLASASRSRRIFGVIDDRMPEVTTAADLTPEFVERFKIEALLDVVPDGERRRILDCLRSICRRAIKMGGRDLDPFQSPPEFSATEASEPISVRPRIYRRNAVELVVMGQSRRSPAELRGRNDHPLVYGRRVPILTRAEYSLIDQISLAFVDGKDGLSRDDLARLSALEAPENTYRDMRRKEGYEAWREVLPDRKNSKKGDLFRMVDPREGEW
jgi:hypothetical protein